MATPQDPADLRDRGLGDLFKKLSEETSTLIRQEMALARAELTEKGKRAGVGAGMLGGAGVAGLLTLGTLTACLILVLNEWMDAWLAALILTVVWAAIAAVLALKGRDKVQEAAPPVPEQTVETLKEDVEWAKTRKSSAAT
jgi:type IV secretory pathway TrbD component